MNCQKNWEKTDHRTKKISKKKQWVKIIKKLKNGKKI